MIKLANKIALASLLGAEEGMEKMALTREQKKALEKKRRAQNTKGRAANINLADMGINARELEQSVGKPGLRAMQDAAVPSSLGRISFAEMMPGGSRPESELLDSYRQTLLHDLFAGRDAAREEINLMNSNIDRLSGRLSGELAHTARLTSENNALQGSIDDLTKKLTDANRNAAEWRTLANNFSGHAERARASYWDALHESLRRGKRIERLNNARELSKGYTNLGKLISKNKGKLGLAGGLALLGAGGIGAGINELLD